MASKVLFLAWGNLWPAHSGVALRHLGLLKQIGRAFDVELLVLSRKPLTVEQEKVLAEYACSVERLALRDRSLGEKLHIFWLMARKRLPYHGAVLEASFSHTTKLREKICTFPSIVYASGGQWGTLIRDQEANNWILDQHNEDVHLWQVSISLTHNPLRKFLSWVNWKLSEKHFGKIYGRVGCVVSVCEEDKRNTQALVPHTEVEVIENGIDCSYYVPHRVWRSNQRILVFTGTSAMRNMIALHWFVDQVLPLIEESMTGVQLIVGGNFTLEAQAEFKSHSSIRFTGRVDDMRPIFDGGDVYVAPFTDTYGSKLKIAEAMAMSMPIVSTVAGVRGFPLVHGESALVARDAEEFAAFTVELLNNVNLCKKLGNNARQIAVSNIDWSVLGKRVIKIIHSLDVDE
jgi:polysaccharide biosynthesis protein PslH